MNVTILQLTIVMNWLYVKIRWDPLTVNVSQVSLAMALNAQVKYKHSLHMLHLCASYLLDNVFSMKFIKICQEQESIIISLKLYNRNQTGKCEHLSQYFQLIWDDDYCGRSLLTDIIFL